MYSKVIISDPYFHQDHEEKTAKKRKTMLTMKTFA